MNIQQQLKSHHLSITPVRVAVLEMLAQNPHTEANHLFKLVQQKISTTSIQAVYNNLNTLVTHNLVREVHIKGMPTRYETQKNDNHHHLVCRSCHIMMDTHCQQDTKTLTPIEDHGFNINDIEIIFWGICPKCQK